MEQLNDEELVRFLQEHLEDDGSYSGPAKKYAAELYDRYYSQGISFCRYYRLRLTDAEDTVQEALVKIFRNIRTFHEGKRFKPWFLKCLLNQINNRFKHLKRLKYNDIDQDCYFDIPDEKNNHQEFQNQHYLEGILNRLPEKLREIVLLKYKRELDFEEIAEVVGVSSRQVRNRLEQGIAMMKVWMEEEANEEKSSIPE